MCNQLDEGRMRYVWTERAEQYYQHLQNIDEYEWSFFLGGPDFYFFGILGDEIIAYKYKFNSVWTRAPEDIVLKELLDKLKQRANASIECVKIGVTDAWDQMKELTAEEFHTLVVDNRTQAPQNM